MQCGDLRAVGGRAYCNAIINGKARLVSSLLCDTASKIGTEPMWEERMEIARATVWQDCLANMERWFTRNFHTHHTAELDGYSNMFLRVPIEGYLGQRRYS